MNLVAKKVVDGFGKTIVKTDAKSFAGAKAQELVTQVEGLLKEAESSIPVVHAHGRHTPAMLLDLEDKVILFGVRTLVLACKKTSCSSDQARYKTMGEVQALFITDVAKLDQTLLSAIPESWSKGDVETKDGNEEVEEVETTTTHATADKINKALGVHVGVGTKETQQDW